jgi:hypothetical protein
LLFINLIFIFFLFSGTNLRAQITKIDSTQIIEVPENAEELHSPKKAAIYSALLPGLGQAYNKKYWKIPIIYAGFGAIGYFVVWNNDNYNTMKVAYQDLTSGDPNEGSHVELFPPEYDFSDQSTYNNAKTALTKQQDYYRRNRDLLIISFVGFYGLNIIDASVDAHLFDFDISEDLSFNWQPAMQSVDAQLVYGFNCRFNF